jgi:hypothetical protein
MKKIILLIVCALSFTGCTLEYRDRGHTPSGPTVYTEYPDTSYVEVEIDPVSVEYYYDDLCWEDPYWYTEEWCDQYDDGTLCCVWYVDGWYEEWCQWGYDYCWDYNGSF